MLTRFYDIMRAVTIRYHARCDHNYHLEKYDFKVSETLTELLSG